jgi:vancomycin resistance protein VanW
MTFRNLVPKSVKIGWQLLKRFGKYRLLRRDIRFARSVTGPELPVRLAQAQPVREGPGYQNKLANLRLAGKRVGEVLVRSGETFSFWRTVGPATKARGFLPGRNLVGGVLREGYGGGLCQLAGLLYHLSLLAGLEIVERHNHSVDIYREADRFTPLGSDATVVYGYRDLMVRNDTAGDLRFWVAVADNEIRATLRSVSPLTARDVTFKRVRESDGEREVLTLDGNGEVLCRSVYGLP